MASIRERKGRDPSRLKSTKGFSSTSRKLNAPPLEDGLLRYAEEVSPSKRSDDKDNIFKLKFLAQHRIGKLSLANLTPKAIAQFRDERLAAVSPGTVLLDLATIRSAHNHARREWGIAMDNPVEKIRKPPAPPHRDRVLSHDEEARLLEILTPGLFRGEDGRFSKETRDPWLKPMVIVAIESAMRRGACCNDSEG